MARKGRVFLVNNIQVKPASGWSVLASDITKCKFTEKSESVSTKYVDGSVEKDKAGETREVRVSYANMDKTTIEAIRALDGTSVPLYIKLGIVNAQKQDYYAPEATVIADSEFEAPGSSSLERGVIFSLRKQSAVVSVNPLTGLPSAAYSNATNSTVTSDNNYDLLIETAVS